MTDSQFTRTDLLLINTSLVHTMDDLMTRRQNPQPEETHSYEQLGEALETMRDLASKVTTALNTTPK